MKWGVGREEQDQVSGEASVRSSRNKKKNNNKYGGVQCVVCNPPSLHDRGSLRSYHLEVNSIIAASLRLVLTDHSHELRGLACMCAIGRLLELRSPSHLA